MESNPVPEELAIRLLVGGPDMCLVCGRTFTRGGAFDVPELLRSPAVCMWCLAQWLGSITGWAVVNQMRGWLVTRHPPGHAVWTELESEDVGDPANER